MSIELQIAFQGGGAKLGVLVAAAEAVHEGLDNRDFRITTISGTSAGAIAACMLATGCMPIIRERLRCIAAMHMNKIVIHRGWWLLGWHLWSGNTLYSEKAYKEFLIDLFTLVDTKFSKLRDLNGCDEILIHAVDLGDREPVIYRKSTHGDMSIADALYNSSALPYIFRTYKQPNPMDGGVVNNFPCGELLENEKAGHVLGFSFEQQKFKREINSLGDFTKALISTMMDNATKNAVEALEKQGGRVCLIKTQRQTLDFEGAIRDDLSDPLFSDVKDQAKDFLRVACTEFEHKKFAASPEMFIENVLKLYRVYAGHKSIMAERVLVTYKCNCLCKKNPNETDTREIEMDFRSSEPLFVFGMRLSSTNDLIGRINVQDEEGNAIETTMLEIPSNYSSKAGDDFADNVIICFHRPLNKGQFYKLRIKTAASQILYDVSYQDKQFTDYIEYSITGVCSVNSLIFVVHIPRQLSVTLNNYEHEVCPRPAGFKWKAGSQLSDTELSKLCELPDPHFRSIGWQTTQLTNGNVTGFSVTGR